MYKDYLVNKDDDFLIEDYLKYNELFTQILEYMNKTSTETIHFWGQVSTHTNGLKLYENAINISKYIDSIKESFNDLMKISLKNLEFLKHYAYFIKEITYNEQELIEINEKINHLNQENQYIVNTDHRDCIVFYYD